MSNRRPPETYQRPQRARDCFTVAAGAIALMLILAASSNLGWLEAITASVVIITGTLAYYVGTTPAPTRATGRVPAIDTMPEVTVSDDFRDIVTAMPMPALLIDAAGRIVSDNADARRVFRLPAGQRPIASASIRTPHFLAAVDRVATGVPPGHEKVDIRTQGETDEMWNAHVLRVTDHADSPVMVLLEDRTAVTRARKARADFLANASHELRTPLTSIAGFIETMRGPARDDKDSWDGFLEIMHDQTERMRTLIADLLALSRIEFSEHRAPSDHCNLAKLVAKSVSAQTPFATERGIQLVIHAPDQKLSIIADKVEMAQVADNLISNALKYARPDTTVTVDMGIASSEEDVLRALSGNFEGASRATLLQPQQQVAPQLVWMRVIDQGAGIPRKNLPRLGERFYRVDESRSQGIAGTGLGLAIVKHIMARHRGGLYVESLEGKGSAFGVWLPARPAKT